MSRFRFSALAVLVVAAATPSLAAPGLAGAKVASLLQSIQGDWQQSCESRDASPNYRRVQLHVSYTHLYFTVSEFADSQCRQLLSSNASRYRFVVGDELRVADGDDTFALHLTTEENKGSAYPLLPRNLVHYRQGKLMFGKSGAESAQGVANHLDYGAVFSR